MIQLLTPANWKNYQLIDSGGFEKLEKFGEFILSRPEPQAAWDKSLAEEEWQRRASAIFRKEKNNPEKGQWELGRGMKDRWMLDYHNGDLKLTLKLALSAFKHVGVFPEQAANWDYIFEKSRKLHQPKVLNLFAYTGAASLAAKAAGADVVHVDSVKQVVSWARENMEASRLDNIRWMVDDAMKFVKREVRRGNIYQAMILDPPAYGRGPEGEKWVLDEHINELLKLSNQLLDPKRAFLRTEPVFTGFFGHYH